MLEINGYLIKERLPLDNNEVEIYKAIKEEGQLPVIIKNIPITDEFHPAIVSLKNEYNILQYLASDSILKTFGMDKHPEGFYIILEDIDGISIKDILQKEFAIDPYKFFSIAIKLAEVLTEIHSKKVIHKDIKSSNIIFNKNTNTTALIDFGISTRLSKEETKLTPPNVLEGSIQYISPEQTGRMNRTVDYRSDFYSLGITFYEMLTGKLPFQSTDLLELIHCHLAVMPDSPNSVNPKIPKMLSDIIMKLLSKTAEERYQTAIGLKKDLERCFQEFQKFGMISDFPLAEKDIRDEFIIQQKLYGRELDIQTLIESFNRVCSTGQTSVMQIAGYSGVGKSALVKEVNKPITQSRGYFLHGKYDQYNKNIPFSAIIQAFTGLIRFILTETPEQIEYWKKSISSALSINGKIITDVIPELELVIGKQPEIMELGSQENANRFYIVFLNFIKVFANQSHPLAVFLDDMQWADSASLALIKNLIEDTSVNYIFIMLAYRDNEVDSTSIFVSTIDDLKKQGFLIEEIKLLPLSMENVNALLSDNLYCDLKQSMALAEVVFSKTGGNPFFITELLKQLVKEENIYFDYELGNWKWDLNKIKETKISENVIELLINKIKKLSNETQHVLKLASCIGNQFNLFTLSQISEIPSYQIAVELIEAVKEELIIPMGDTYKVIELLKNLENKSDKYNRISAKFFYRFQHDRVQQASYELIEETKKKELRLEIGKLLLKNTSAEKLEERVFDIVNHINVGIELVKDPLELYMYVELNLAAGQKAKVSTAYKQALDYTTKAVGLYTELWKDKNPWKDNYTFTLSIYKEFAEILYLNGNFEDSEVVIYKLVEQIESPIDKAEIYRLLIIQYTLNAKYQQAIQSLKKGLALLGITLPDDNLQEFLNVEIGKVTANLGNRKISSLIDQPEISVPEIKIAVKILTTATPTSYFISPVLWTLIVFMTVNLCLTYGNVGETYGYSCYGILLGSAFGDYKSGYEYSLLAVKISEKFNNLSEKTKGANVLANHVSSWVNHIKEADKINEDGLKAGLDSGELQHASYIYLHLPVNHFHQGINLSDIISHTNKYLQFTKKVKNFLAVDMVNAIDILANNLIGTSEHYKIFGNQSYSETIFLENCTKNSSMMALSVYKIVKSFILYLYSDYEEAYKFTLESKDLLSYITGAFSVAEHNFYYSLILCALYPTASNEEKEEFDKQLEINQAQMKIWSDNCSANFLHKFLLVEAERKKLAKNYYQAFELYEEAIEEATKNDFIQNEALAKELTGAAWIEKGNRKIGIQYLFEAYIKYNQWGAKRKLELMQKKYPELIGFMDDELAEASGSIGKTINKTSIQKTQSIDLQTILKSSSAISGEIKLENLIEKIMYNVVENTGAQRGILFLKKDDNKLYVEGECSIAREENLDVPVASTATIKRSLQVRLIMASIPITDYILIPISIVYYVERTKEQLVLQNASIDEKFKNHSYVKNNQLKSVLCYPILNQGKLTGVLYLENNLSEGAFTPERLKIVSILASQAAISIDNAILYANLEKKVEERTKELALANEELADKNRHITESITYSKTIQEAILPSKTAISRNLKDFFILFSPKDIVSGDFYWYSKTSDCVLIAAADCTGHGVPGALMSMIGNTFLNQIVNEMHITDPALILENLNISVRTTLKQDREDNPSRDGMDICLVRLDNEKVTFAGAKRPLYVIKEGGVVETIKGDKDSIGGKQKEEVRKYTNNIIPIVPNERMVVYLTSDGFADQPSPTGQKIGSKKLIELITKYHSLGGLEQKEKFFVELKMHVQDEPQRDDITMIGVII